MIFIAGTAIAWVLIKLATGAIELWRKAHEEARRS